MRATLLFWEKLVFCYMELLKYCRNVANVKTLWYDEVVPKNRHPHLRLKHRRADAEHIRPETNPIQVSFRLEDLTSEKRRLNPSIGFDRRLSPYYVSRFSTCTNTIYGIFG